MTNTMIYPSPRLVDLANDHPTPLVYAYCWLSRPPKTDKSIEWNDCLQITALALLECGHFATTECGISATTGFSPAIIAAIRKAIRLEAKSQQGLTRSSQDPQLAKDREAKRKRLKRLATAWQEKPGLIGKQATDLGYSPIEIITRLGDPKIKSIIQDASRVAARGLGRKLGKLWDQLYPGTTSQRTCIWGPDSRPSSPGHLGDRFGNFA